MNPIEDLRWNIAYARQEQLERLERYMETQEHTIGGFLNSHVAEWQLDALIRIALPMLNQIEAETKKKPNKLLFWKK